MKINFEKRMNKFIALVNKEYPNLYVDYVKNKSSNSYKIWHNSEELEYNDIEFRLFTGKLLTELFLDNEIYNVYMTYDYERSLSIRTNEFIFEDTFDVQILPIKIKCPIFGDNNGDFSDIDFNIAIVIDNYTSDEDQELKSNKLKSNDAANDNFALAAWGKYDRKHF